jgi:hypothetical protein
MMLELVLMAVLGAPDAGLPTKQAMQGGFEALTTLVWLTSPEAPKTGQDEVIRLELQKLEALPHVFDTKGKKEPGVAAIASLFKSYIARTRSRFEAGELETVGFRVRTLSGLCFACHTREQVPGDFTDGEKRFEALKLGTLGRAQALAATRQFDRSLSLFREVLTSPQSSYRDVSRAMEDLMTVIVRAKNDPVLVMAVLDEVSARKDLPDVAKQRVAALQAEVKAWQAEAFDSATASSDVLIAKSEELVKSGGDVALLRASAYLSRALTLNPKHAKRPRALYLLGVSAAKVRSPLLWDLDLLYFEACVRENPKSASAKQCFNSFNERLVLGFSGSAGTRIPPDEQARLDQLKALAGVK